MELEDEWELIDDVDADWEKVTSEADAKTAAEQARLKTGRRVHVLVAGSLYLVGDLLCEFGWSEDPPAAAAGGGGGGTKQ